MEKTKHKASASTDKINTSTIDDLDKRPRLQVVPDAGSGSSREAKGSWRETWETYKGMTMVLGAESFGSGMAVATKLLEMGGADGMPGMQAPQVRIYSICAKHVTDNGVTDPVCAILDHLGV